MMKDEIQSRRAVLRGALAVGCGLLIPAALMGCGSKQGESSTSPDPTSPDPASPAGMEPAAPATSGKATQTSVQYQAQPKGEQKCGGCMHFNAESGTCAVVDGQVIADGWCSLWTKKA